MDTFPPFPTTTIIQWAVFHSFFVPALLAEVEFVLARLKRAKVFGISGLVVVAFLEQKNIDNDINAGLKDRIFLLWHLRSVDFM